MTSHRLKRTMRGAVATAAVLSAASMIPATASADPNPPANSSDALKQYQDLSTQAEQVSEDLNKAQEDLAAKQAELAKANGDLAQATDREKQFRGQVGQFANAAYEGARFDQLTALLTANSPGEYIDQATVLNELATQNKTALDGLSSAVAQATKARNTAQQATDAAAKLTNDIQGRKQALDAQIAQVKSAFGKLSKKERDSLDEGDLTGSFQAPPGMAGAVIAAAMAERGRPYVWGATGPSSFDCSGLTKWAFRAAGMSLPRTAREQYQMGTSVAKGAWQPGDLLFFGSSASSIHHVALYIGGGMIVHAPTEGVPVQAVPVAKGGRDYFGAKRLLG